MGRAKPASAVSARRAPTRIHTPDPDILAPERPPATRSRRSWRDSDRPEWGRRHHRAANCWEGSAPGRHIHGTNPETTCGEPRVLGRSRRNSVGRSVQPRSRPQVATASATVAGACRYPAPTRERARISRPSQTLASQPAPGRPGPLAAVAGQLWAATGNRIPATGTRSARSVAGAAVRVRYRAVGGQSWSYEPSGTVRTNGAARIAPRGVWSGPTAGRADPCARRARTGATGSGAAMPRGSGTGSGCGGCGKGTHTGRAEQRERHAGIGEDPRCNHPRSGLPDTAAVVSTQSLIATAMIGLRLLPRPLRLRRE